MIPKDQMRGWARVAWFEWLDNRGYRRHPDIARWIGVYAIWRGARLLYVGTSKNVHTRLKTHFLNWNSGRSRFPTHATALQCMTEQLAAELESELIRTHKPVRNMRNEPKGGQVRVHHPMPQWRLDQRRCAKAVR